VIRHVIAQLTVLSGCKIKGDTTGLETNYTRTQSKQFTIIYSCVSEQFVDMAGATIQHPLLSDRPYQVVSHMLNGATTCQRVIEYDVANKVDLRFASNRGPTSANCTSL